MDPLSEILKSMTMRHTAVGTMRLTAPWGLSVPEFGQPVAYGFAGGDPCWVRVSDGEMFLLCPGDVVFTKAAHQLLSSPESTTASIFDAWATHGFPDFEPSQEPSAPLHLRWGMGGPETHLLGLAFGLDGGERNPMVASLPPYILLRAGSNRLPWIDGAIQFLVQEHANTAGYAATARLLAELMFVSIVRSHLLLAPRDTRGWLRGLAEPGIAKALQAIHERPGEPWTVGTLAQLAGLSRTTFATRFSELVETAPIDYLTQWRMHLAAERIVRSRPNLTKLAFDLGYTSDAAFRDAFRRRYGMAPSRYGQASAATDLRPSDEETSNGAPRTGDVRAGAGAP